MKYILLISLFELSILFTAGAQKNLVDGYILSHKLDTTYGAVDDKNYFKNSLFCDFQKDKNAKTTRYYPADIYGYRFSGGKYYISKVINIEGRDSMIFLEYLINGQIDFYFRQDKNRINHYYVSKNESPIFELKYADKILYQDGKIYEKESKQYINVLEFLTIDCPEIKNEILKLAEPNHKNLIKLGEEYHNLVCKDRKCIIYDKKIRYKFLVEIASGYKLFYYNHDYYRSPGTPFLGANFYVSNPRFSEKSYFGIGYFYEGRSIIDSSGISYHNFKIPLTYGYSSSQPGFSPILQAGVNIRNFDDVVFTSVSFSPGVKYNFNKIFLKVYIDFEFESLILVPVLYHSTNFGVSINYKLN